MTKPMLTSYIEHLAAAHDVVCLPRRFSSQKQSSARPRRHGHSPRQGGSI